MHISESVYRMGSVGEGILVKSTLDISNSFII